MADYLVNAGGWWTLLANFILWAVFFGASFYVIGLRPYPVEGKSDTAAESEQKRRDSRA